MRRTRKPVGGVPLKRKGERESAREGERVRERGRLNTIGEKRAELGKAPSYAANDK